MSMGSEEETTDEPDEPDEDPDEVKLLGVEAAVEEGEAVLVLPVLLVLLLWLGSILASGRVAVIQG